MARTDTVEQSLYFPEPLLEQICRHALRTDRSLSYIVQKAWKHAGPQISAMTEDEVREVVSGASPVPVDKRKQNLYFPVTMRDEIQELSIKLDTSMSHVVQAAFLLAVPTLEKIPDVTQFG